MKRDRPPNTYVFSASNFRRPTSSARGGTGGASARKSTLETEGDSEMMPTTGEASFSAAAWIDGIRVCSRIATHCAVVKRSPWRRKIARNASRLPRWTRHPTPPALLFAVERTPSASPSSNGRQSTISRASASGRPSYVYPLAFASAHWTEEEEKNEQVSTQTN